MALNHDQWNAVTEATKTIRALGCAVCVFTPDDMESAMADHTLAENIESAVCVDTALNLLYKNRKYIEEAMCNAGNIVVNDAIWDATL